MSHRLSRSRAREGDSKEYGNFYSVDDQDDDDVGTAMK